ncbi:MAG: FAD-dependent oxidoreductase, partial [Proteobacteria bacterium]
MTAKNPAKTVLKALSKTTQTEIYDCIVIGAGAAGLACARRLLDEKKKVLILEARSR